MQEPQNSPAVRFLPGQKTQGFGSVQVTNPPRHSGSCFWPGNDPNWTEQPAKNRTSGGLPGPVANTTQVLASFIAKSGSNTLPAPLWKWAANDRQQFKVLHPGQFQWRMNANLY